MAACGGASQRSPALAKRDVAALWPAPGQRPAAQVPSAPGVALTAVPGAPLARCLTSPLLRPICPRLMPLTNASRVPGAMEYSCARATGRDTRAPAATTKLFSSGRCVDAEWGYEIFAPLPGLPQPQQISAWDGTQWFNPGYAPRDPPPYFAHIDIEAAVGAPPLAVSVVHWPRGAHRLTDSLLNPQTSAPATSLGWVRWSGREGQLVVMNAGAEEAGHVIFYFGAGNTNYDISLHAWASKERISERHFRRVITDDQPGPALPHVIATLKGIVHSALARQS